MVDGGAIMDIKYNGIHNDAYFKIYSNSNMNDLRISSGYYVNCTNSPHAYCQGFTLRNNANDGVQILAAVNSENPYIAVRAYTTGAGWGNWKRYNQAVNCSLSGTTLTITST